MNAQGRRIVSRKITMARKAPPRAKPRTMPTISLSGSPPPAKQTWWSQRFIEVLESFKMGSRLARGKAYAQEAKVVKLGISSGIVTSLVQGSRKNHYKVSIRLEPLSDAQWRQVFNNITRKAIYGVEILQDKIPRDIEEVFSSARVSLFPGRLEELKSECDCPDWSNPCKHIAATYYVLAQHFDLDPYLIFVWRGRMKTQILEALRQNWRQGKSSGSGQSQRLLLAKNEVLCFWEGDPNVPKMTPLDPFSRAVPDSVIKKLGTANIQLDGMDLSEVFAETYNIASNATRAWVMSPSLMAKPGFSPFSDKS